MTANPADYRRAIYPTYLSSRDEASPETVAARIAVRAEHCRRIIRDFFPTSYNARIVELGCGYGALLYYAAATGYRDLRGVDQSLEQIVAAQTYGITEVIRGDCLEFLGDEADQSLDAVISLDLIEHFDKPELCGLVIEVARVLKPNGRWIIHCPNGESPLGGRVRYGDFTHEQGFTQDSLRQLLYAYGFARVECFEDGPLAHGVKSGLRFVLWRAIHLALRICLVAETGQVNAAPIFTQNLFCIAYK
ncbi:MAG: class I SAM-dependent methyltransferase [Candidatus Binataceae bacterium]